MLGLTARALAWGTWATAGLTGFVIVQDQGAEKVAGTALFVAELGKAIDYDAPIGIGLGTPTTVTSFKGATFKPDAWYKFDARPFNAAGVIGDGHASPQMLRTDATGAFIDPAVPNPPSFVSARLRAAGKVLVAVGYSRFGETASPADMEVYGKQVTDPVNPDSSGLWDAGNLQTDEVSSLTAITVPPGASRMQFNVSAKADAQYWIFGAVFRNAAGGRGNNESISNAVLIDAGGAAETPSFSVI